MVFNDKKFIEKIGKKITDRKQLFELHVAGNHSIRVSEVKIKDKIDSQIVIERHHFPDRAFSPYYEHFNPFPLTKEELRQLITEGAKFLGMEILQWG